MPSALISGASIAGPTLSFWLSRAGFDVVVIEKSAARREGGQAIDVRGPALTIIESMGLLPTVIALRTHHRGMSIVDLHGNEIDKTTERTASAGRLDSGDVEIFRDDLSRVLIDASADKVTYCYGESIEAVEPNGDQVCVTFKSRPPRSFDLVIGADGLHSHVRSLAFESDPSRIHPLGVGFAIFTAPNSLGLENWQIAFRDAVSGYVVYPSLDNSNLRVNLGFALVPEEFPRGDPAAQRNLIFERSARFGGIIPDLLRHLPAASDIWFGPLAQVKMPNWSNGRFVLVGDSAFCPSPFTGQGTSLAIIGAYVLAKELARALDAPELAFQRYERKMRPFVDLNQALLNLERHGPVPDGELQRAKNGIDLSEYGLGANHWTSG